MRVPFNGSRLLPILLRIAAPQETKNGMPVGASRVFSPASIQEAGRNRFEFSESVPEKNGFVSGAVIKITASHRGHRETAKPTESTENRKPLFYILV
jgi:hypothetical protein